MKDFYVALGGGNEIGASCYLLHVSGKWILIDAGMRLNAKRAFPDFARLFSITGGLDRLDAFLLTHAHLDHCGSLTRVHYEAPRIPKYATSPTIELAATLLKDALQISRKQKTEDWFIIEST